MDQLGHGKTRDIDKINMHNVILHKVTNADCVQHSASLAGKRALTSTALQLAWTMANA